MLSFNRFSSILSMTPNSSPNISCSCKQTPMVDQKLLINVHEGLQEPTVSGTSYLTKGSFQYYHYACDSFKDQGWGCAYRTLQSMASWIINSQKLPHLRPPDIAAIQRTLVSLADKPPSFIGSRDWIGALEVFFVIDALYNVPCKILHVSTTDDLKSFAGEVQNYFETYGGLIMMGGDLDSSSKGIAGLHINGGDVYLLVIDPHFVKQATDTFTKQDLQRQNYIRWQHLSEFIDSSFYNLCLPLLKQEPRNNE